ncbi:MAG TPA: nucleoside phosphorylase [Chloroflexota bacterium]|nr:nucleoside phosphorylase [Chloroflexota bacterium]
MEREQSDLQADRPAMEGGRQYHIHLGSGELPATVLLPGDPGRVPVLAAAWDAREDVAYHREYRSMRGSYRGVPIAACSTGIGGPSTEIAINELAQIGCTTFLRLGTTGGLQEPMRVGDVVISTASIRWEGASAPYAPEAYPAAASYEAMLALMEACERLRLTYHLGVSASTSSFYAGQSRPAVGGYIGMEANRVERLQAMGVMNFEMEAATIFTLCSLFGLRAGAACVIIADRFRNEFRPGGWADELLARIGAETVAVLAEMDRAKQRAGRRWFIPSLSPART